jgi:hypothetical protein
MRAACAMSGGSRRGNALSFRDSGTRRRRRWIRRDRQAETGDGRRFGRRIGNRGRLRGRERDCRNTGAFDRAGSVIGAVALGMLTAIPVRRAAIGVRRNRISRSDRSSHSRHRQQRQGQGRQDDEYGAEVAHIKSLSAPSPITSSDGAVRWKGCFRDRCGRLGAASKRRAAGPAASP